LTEWAFVQKDAAEELAQLHFFIVKKQQPGGDVEFRITVKEFAVPPPGLHATFFAQADKQINQKTAPLTPCGWGNTLLKALGDCVRQIREFPYEGE